MASALAFVKKPAAETLVVRQAVLPGPVSLAGDK
jgi:hypothetical protein